MFTIVNDEQTADELNVSILSSQWNCFISVLIIIVALIVQNRMLILAFKYLAKFFLVFLPQPFTHKESVFSFKLFRKLYILIVFLHVPTDHDGGKQFLRRMERKPHISL